MWLKCTSAPQCIIHHVTGVQVHLNVLFIMWLKCTGGPQRFVHHVTEVYRCTSMYCPSSNWSVHHLTEVYKCISTYDPPSDISVQAQLNVSPITWQMCTILPQCIVHHMPDVCNCIHTHTHTHKQQPSTALSLWIALSLCLWSNTCLHL